MSLEYPCIYFRENGLCSYGGDLSDANICVFGPCDNETPSNGDKLRRMSDEELAEWLTYPVCKHADCALKCPVIPENKNIKCVQNILNWLRQPAEED